MTLWSKKVAALLLFIFILTGLTGCQKESLNNGSPDTVSYTMVTELPETISAAKITYIVNVNTKKFHCPECPSVEQMSEHNKWEYIGNRDDLISSGYKPCKRCEP